MFFFPLLSFFSWAIFFPCSHFFLGPFFSLFFLLAAIGKIYIFFSLEPFSYHAFFFPCSHFFPGPFFFLTLTFFLGLFYPLFFLLTAIGKIKRTAGERKRTRHTHGSEGRREGARLPAQWNAYVDGTIRVVIDVMVPSFRQE